MKIVKVYEPEQRKSIVIKGQTQKVYEKLGYYFMLIKARCGNQRIEIRETDCPNIFNKIKSGEIKAGRDLIMLLEQVLSMQTIK